MGTNSEFGKQFDSLADVVSFGIAPAFLAYVWGVRAMAACEAPQALHLVQLGWLIGFFFVVCCAWRLARFNIQGMAPGRRPVFRWHAHAGGGGHDRGGGPLCGLSDPGREDFAAVAAAGAGARRSDVEHGALLQLQGYSVDETAAVACGGADRAAVGAVVYFSRPRCSLIAGAYTPHGVVIQVVRTVRHRLASRPA